MMWVKISGCRIEPSFERFLAITIVKSQKTRLEKVRRANHSHGKLFLGIGWQPTHIYCYPGDYCVKKTSIYDLESI